MLHKKRLSRSVKAVFAYLTVYFTWYLLQLRVLDGDVFPGLGEIEHVQDDGLGAAVLATMDFVNHFHQRLALAERAFCAVQADDRQFTLFHNSIIDNRVVVPACNGADGEKHSCYFQFRPSCGEVRQLCAVPTLGGSD